MTQMLKGWRTITINALTLVVAVLAVLDTAALSPDAAKIVLGASAALNIVLRILTTGPVGSKE